MKISPITPAEFQRASEIVRIAFDHRSAQDQSEEGIRVFRGFASADAIRQRFNQGCLSLVAEVEVGNESQLVGFIQVKQTHLILFFVLPEFQGQGIARALFDAADHAQPILTVNSSPNAEAIYAQLGFIHSYPEPENSPIRHIPMKRAGR